MVRLAARLLAPSLLAAVLVAIPARLPAQQPTMGRKVAFLVGVGEYKHHAKSNQLGAAPVNDVTAMKEVLEANGFRVVLLTNEQATRETVLEQLQLALEGKTKPTDKRDALGNRDVLLVMLCGHGIQVEATIPNDPEDPDRKNKRLQPYFQVHDTDPKDTDTMVPFNQLVRMAGDKHVRSLFLVDACRENTDPNLRGTTRTGIARGKAVLPEGVSIFYSCQEGELANQDDRTDPRGQGLFTWAILRTLRGETSGKKPVGWLRLVADVSESFRDDAELKAKIPEGRRQRPGLLQGDDAEDIVLVTPGASEPKPGEEREFEIADRVKMKFCYIPKGKATLGSPVSEKDRRDDEQEHAYEEKTGFWLGKYPVTQQEWTAVMGTTPFQHAKFGLFGSEAVKGLDTTRFPADMVSWEGAKEFLGRLNKRAKVGDVFGNGVRCCLPHEDRWEYAYRGGKGNANAFYWGGKLNGDKANCDGTKPHGTVDMGVNLKRTTKVGEYEKAAPHPWGLCDMSGNVFQLCENPFRAGEIARAIRGGAYFAGASGCRAANRNEGGALFELTGGTGFRVCIASE